jgi:hypothetical protein
MLNEVEGKFISYLILFILHKFILVTKIMQGSFELLNYNKMNTF